MDRGFGPGDRRTRIAHGFRPEYCSLEKERDDRLLFRTQESMNLLVRILKIACGLKPRYRPVGLIMVGRRSRIPHLLVVIAWAGLCSRPGKRGDVLHSTSIPPISYDTLLTSSKMSPPNLLLLLAALVKLLQLGTGLSLWDIVRAISWHLKTGKATTISCF